MTTFEHALLGVNGALALGLHRRFGWRVAPLAAIAAVAPDWDGIPMFIDMARFESGHRVWGHNLLACILLGLVIVELDRWLNVSGRIANSFARLNASDREENGSTAKSDFSWFAWAVIAIAAALSQIPADLVVSGGEGLSDWPLKPLWPFSDMTVVYPMVPWGNVGVTVIFAIAMLGQAKFPKRVQPIAIGALCLMVVYIVLWKWL